MKIYDIEREHGLADKILAQSSIAFLSPTMDLCTTAKANTLLVPKFAFAEANDPDLYKTLSVLVSTVWNRNDDIFDKYEVWAARNTPTYKPTNLDHDESKIVGGMIESWPTDYQFNLISKDVDSGELPEEFHIIVASVIYRQWQNPELKARCEALIEQIEAGEKYVSMECLFRGFDYGVKAPDGTNHIVARSAETAFLTRHLRAYGGTGEYDGHKVGRLLRSITFSGKGYVDRPANPDSIIFDKDYVLSFANVKDTKDLLFKKNGVTNSDTQVITANSIGENNMDNDLMNNQIKELKEALASAKAENKDLSDKLSEVSVSTYEAKVKELEANIATITSAKEDVATKLSEANDKVSSLENDLSEKIEAMKKLSSEMDMMKEEKKKKDRKEKMVQAGLSDEEASTKADKFGSLSDEQFEEVVNTIAAMYDKKKKGEKDMKDTKAEDDSDEVSTSASDVVDSDTKEEGTCSASAENESSERETAVAALQEWIEKSIVNTK